MDGRAVALSLSSPVQAEISSTDRFRLSHVQRAECQRWANNANGPHEAQVPTKTSMALPSVGRSGFPSFTTAKQDRSSSSPTMDSAEQTLRHGFRDRSDSSSARRRLLWLTDNTGNRIVIYDPQTGQPFRKQHHSSESIQHRLQEYSSPDPGANQRRARPQLSGTQYQLGYVRHVEH